MRSSNVCSATSGIRHTNSVTLSNIQSQPNRKCLAIVHQASPRSFQQLRSSEHHRLTSDLAACFKIVHGSLVIAFSFNDLFTSTSNASSRGHSIELTTPSHTVHRKHLFSTRIIEIWNALPSSLVHASSVSAAFKKRLLSHDLTDAPTVPFYITDFQLLRDLELRFDVWLIAILIYLCQRSSSYHNLLYYFWLQHFLCHYQAAQARTLCVWFYI
jgi:hypothetical protein